ncbi:MAG: hypothetical protein JXR45_00040 [Deltaproteobacteria bacterium]|nr:hypothetical protein [Deltaproteobacteria bacterium]
MSNEDTDPVSTDDTESVDTDSQTIPVYNGIPGAAPGECRYSYAPINLHATLDDGTAQAGIRFTYDSLGNLVQLESDVPVLNRTLFTYDGYQLTQTVHETLDPSGLATSRISSTFTYNESLPVEWMSVHTYLSDTDTPSVRTVRRFTYEDGKLSTVNIFDCDTDSGCDDAVDVLSYDYDTDGRLNTVSGITNTVDFTYNPDGTVLATALNDAGGTTETASEYTYENGRILTKTTDGVVRTFFYENDRVVRTEFAGNPSSTTAFTYSDEADACALLRAWTVSFVEPYEHHTSQLLMMFTYGDSAPTELFY